MINKIKVNTTNSYYALIRVKLKNSIEMKKTKYHLENIKYGITSNTIQLGYFDGGMTYRIPEENLKKIQQTIGLNRFGKIEELTNTIKFIIENEYVTGVNIKIDGGLQ